MVTKREKPPAEPKQRDQRPWWIALGLALLTSLLYWPVRNYEFINYDDLDYVVNNTRIHAGWTKPAVVWAFTQFTGGFSYWHPLTWLSHMLDCQLFGINAGPHHLMNLLFHVLNSVLLFLLAWRMTGALWRSAFVAALFAWHPLQVDTVAWVAERKNLLSTFFFFLTLLAYVCYARKPTLARYSLVFLLFCLVLMSKAALLVLPCLLLVLDFWPLRRMNGLASIHSLSATPHPQFSGRRLVLEKLPLFGPVAFSCVATLMAHRALGILVDLNQIPFTSRVANAFVSYLRYVEKAVVPIHLAIFYPHPGQWPVALVFLAVGFVLVISFFAVKWAVSRPYFLGGWLWFLGVLFPTIGLIQGGGQAMADRFAYVPLIGLFVMLAWGGEELLTRWRHWKIASVTVGICACVTAFAVSRVQLQYWKNSETLFRHALKVAPANEVSCNNLGMTLAVQGKNEEAKSNYLAAIQFNPRNYKALQNLGILLSGEGKADEAMQYYAKALQLNKNLEQAQNNWGLALAMKGQLDEALPHLVESLRINSRYADAHNNLGNVLMLKGQANEAIAHFSMAAELAPASVNANKNLGRAQLAQGHSSQAISPLLAALRAEPGDAETHYYLGSALAKEGKMDQAIDHYLFALQGSPDNADVLRDLALALASTGKLDEAIGYFSKALQLKPEDPVLRNNFGNVLVLRNRLDDAATQYSAALKIDPALAEAHYNLAMTLIKQKKREEARSHLLSALRLKPDYSEAKLELSTLNTAP